VQLDLIRCFGVLLRWLFAAAALLLALAVAVGPLSAVRPLADARYIARPIDLHAAPFGF
jgi:hypothetical protein